MRNKLTFLFAAAAGLLTSCQLPERKPPKPDTGIPEIEAVKFYETTTIANVIISGDGSRVLYSSDESGIFNVYVQKIATPPEPPARLTNSTTNATYAVDFFPGDERILFTSDQGGNELNHLYLREADGSTRDLTPGDKLKAEFRGWSADRRSFFVSTNERDPQFSDLYRYFADPSRGYSRELLFENKDKMTIGAVSADGQWVALVKTNSNSDSNIYLCDTRNPDTGTVLLTSHSGDAIHGVEGFSPDSKDLYYSTNQEGEFENIWKFRLETSAKSKIYAGDWDITNITISENGRRTAVMMNVDAAAGLSVFNDRTPVPLPPLPRGQFRSLTFSDDGNRLAFVASGDREPSNIYIVDVEKKESQVLTDTLSRDVRRQWLVDSKVVRYKSYDGLEIPAILYKPPGANKDWKAPAIVYVHGGPGGQTLVQYSADIQFLVNHGYAVLAVNNRGSGGYGKTFYHLDDKKHGDVDLKDCIWARRYLESLDWVDGGRVAIMGGSYGGYMVAAALAFTPDAFDCGIDIFGVTNWLRTLKSIPAWWEERRKSLYDELGDPTTPAGEKALREKSPLFYAKQIKKPLLVIQGKNDPRVLEAESREIVQAVSENGVPVQFVLFDDEGHGFRNKLNRIKAAMEYVRFLDRYLR